jgi:hypothetical protein
MRYELSDQARWVARGTLAARHVEGEAAARSARLRLNHLAHPPDQGVGPLAVRAAITVRDLRLVSISRKWRSRDKVSQVPLFQPVGSPRRPKATQSNARSSPMGSDIGKGLQTRGSASRSKSAETVPGSMERRALISIDLSGSRFVTSRA